MAKKIKVQEELCEGCGDTPVSSIAKKSVKEGKFVPFTKNSPGAFKKKDEDETEEDEEKEIEEEMEEDEEEIEEEIEEEMEEDEEEIEEEMEEDEEEMEEDEEEMEDDEEDEEEMEEGYTKKSMKESMKEIFGGKELSEEFKLKASTLFESAVNQRVKLVEYKLAKKFTNLLESEVEEIANSLTEKVDSYLNYVVSEWMEENKLVVERGIRTDVAEGFIEGLKNLFLENNINVPEGQTDLLDETANNLQKVSEQLNKQVQKNMQLTENLKMFERAEIFANTADGLSSAQTEHLRTLAENMEFSNSKEFGAKLAILKENFQKSTRTKSTLSSIQVEDDATTTLSESVEPSVSAYLKAMIRTQH